MATMQFRISNGEFVNIVQALRRRGEIKRLKTDEEKVKKIVDFFQYFMIDMENEAILGFYPYNLIVDEETIPLDSKESEERLRELVKSVWV